MVKTIWSHIATFIIGGFTIAMLAFIGLASDDELCKNTMRIYKRYFNL